jgi:hypothetical protein
MVLGALLAKPVDALADATGKALSPLFFNTFTNKIDEKLGLRPDPEYARVRDRVERRYEEALKESQQNTARQLDNLRINNAPAPTNASAATHEFWVVGTATLACPPTWIPFSYKVSDCLDSDSLSPTFRQTYANCGGASAYTYTGTVNGQSFTEIDYTGWQGAPTIEKRLKAAITPPNTSPAPYPDKDTWLYGSVEVQVTGNALALSKKLWEGNGLKPFKEPEKQAPLPIVIAPSTPPSQERKAVEPSQNPNTGLNRAPSGLPIVGDPNAKEPQKKLGLIPSMSKPSFSARPFVSGVSDPSEAYEPRDSKTGLTRAELEQQWVSQQNQIQENGKANERAAALNDAKNIKQQLDNLSDTPNPDLGGKSPKQQQTEAYLNSIKGNEIRESAFKQVANNTSPLNSTPTTPSNNPNTVQILGGIAGVAATVTALKIGSDLLVNNSLSNTPKIDQIAQNTTNTNQQNNAKQGVCDAFQPQQCGFEGAKQASVEATQPIKDVANANNGLLQALLAALQAIQTFLTSNIGKIIDLLNRQVIDRSLAVMNLATNIHNAAMLTRDIGETLGSVVDNVLNLSGLKFTNSEGAQIQFTDFIGSNFRAFLVSVLGAENYVSLVLQWQKANTIYHATMGVINTTQSMLDPISSAVEYGMENVSKIGNSLKEDGVVSENAYPAMDETIRARRVNRFERLNDTLEGAENIASNLSSVTSSAVSIKEDYKQLREDSKDLRDKATAFNTADSEARAALKAELPTEITPITLAPAPAEDEET